MNFSTIKKAIKLAFLCMVYSLPAYAAYMPFNTNVNMNVGIGTSTPLGALTVMNGNVGIGTWVPGSALNVHGAILAQETNPAAGITFGVVGPATFANVAGAWNGANPYLKISADAQTLYMYQPSSARDMYFGTKTPIGIQLTQLELLNSGSVVINPNGGNVGIGSVAPAGSLDVSPTGTICFGSSCKTSWAGANNYWSLAGGTGNVGISTTNTVGIGTTSGVGAGLVVMNGNVGIGTWVPADLLDVEGGRISQAGSSSITGYLRTNSTDTVNTTSLNPGIAVFGATGVDTTYGMDLGYVNGRYGTRIFTGDNGRNITFGHFNAVTNPAQSDFVTWMYMSAGKVGIGTMSPGSTLSILGGMGIGSATYANTAAPSNGIIVSGNVGIGTTTPQGGLVVTNGNVGIGTWTAVGGNLIVNGGGNVGISSAWPGTTLDVNGTVRATAMLIGANSVCQSTGTNCPAGGTNPWLVVQAAGNVGISTTRSVGIGTTSAGPGAGLLS